MRSYLDSLVIFITISGTCVAQGPGTTAVPFLLIGPSPDLGASQGAGAVIPTDDAFGFYYNPAQLAVFSHNNNFAFQFYPVKTKWLPQFHFDDLTFNNTVFTAGYTYKNLYKDIDLDIGIGYLRTFLNLGENIATGPDGNEIGRFSSFESCDAYSIGFGFKYYANFAFGYTYKKINSNLAPDNFVVGTETINGRADGSAYDLGVLVNIPIIDAGDSFNFEGMNFFSNAYLGFAVVNTGDFLNYGDKSQSDPLPKTERLGLGFSIGSNENFGLYDIKTIELEFANEANNILIKSVGEKKSYRSAFDSDIKIWDNILSGKSTDLVEVQSSIKINIFESLYIGFHKMKGPGHSQFVYNTSFTISTSGIFKLLANNQYDSFLDFIINHTDLRYSLSDIDAKNSPSDDTQYKSIALHLKKLF